MKNTSPTIVFFGSGSVAARSLELLSANFTIEAVVTKPKPAHHRGSFPVLDLAEKLDLPVCTVTNKQELSALMATKPFTSTTGVLIDFGIIVAQDTIDYFPKGIVNSHFSLLPEWRGADPITFALLSGQKQTGVSLMLLVEAMDEGPLLGFGIQKISADETTTTLSNKLIELSAALLRDTLPAYINDVPHPLTNTVTVPRTQEGTPTYSRKLTKEDGRLDWTKPAEQLEREVRAYNEWPKSYTTLGDIDVVITKALAVPSNGPGAKPGDLDITKTDGMSILMVNTSSGSLDIERLKPAGKQEMTAQAFLNGYGSKLGL